jgi:hypothetical protein
MMFGPQTMELESLLERFKDMDDFQRAVLASDWRKAENRPGPKTSRVKAWDAAALMEREDVRQLVFNTVDFGEHAEVWDAAVDGAEALVVRDLISKEDYMTLTGPVRHVFGQLHPND